MTVGLLQGGVHILIMRNVTSGKQSAIIASSNMIILLLGFLIEVPRTSKKRKNVFKE